MEKSLLKNLLALKIHTLAGRGPGQVISGQLTKEKVLKVRGDDRLRGGSGGRVEKLLFTLERKRYFFLRIVRGSEGGGGSVLLSEVKRGRFLFLLLLKNGLFVLW